MSSHPWTILMVVVLSVGTAFAEDYTKADCPVVGNTGSRIYHVPGGEFYSRMLRKNLKGDNRKCFSTEQAAVQGGYRKSKR